MAGPSGSTPALALPYPIPSDTVDVPRDVQALATKLDGFGFPPVGVIMMWPNASAPTGWLLCQGQQVPASSYPQLANVIPPVSGQITLPDLRGRVPLGVSASHALNSSGGAETVALGAAEMPAHSHTGPSHTHAVGTLAAASSIIVAGSARLALANQSNIVQYPISSMAGAVTVPGSNGGTWSNEDGAHTHTLSGATAAGGTGATGNAGGGGAHENMPPYLSINYIIRVG